MTPQQFKQRWESGPDGDGITWDDIAACAKAWGLFSTPKTKPMADVKAAVLRHANTWEDGEGPVVYHLRGAKPANGRPCIAVDRGTPWGNPFIMETEADRNAVCNKFIKYAEWRLTIEPDWLEPLRGNNLACWCAPKRCHAMTLLRLANQ